MRDDVEHSLCVPLFLALVRNEPAWRTVVLDLEDVRPGGHVIARDSDRRILSCANWHVGEEVGLPASEIHVFVALDETRPLLYSRGEVRTWRANAAKDRVLAARTPRPGREVVNWGAALADAARLTPGNAGDDDVAAGARLLEVLVRHQPGPWDELQVTRCRSSGGLWAFGRQALGGLLVASHDVEARRLETAPTLQWLPEPGVVALASFFGLEPLDPEA